MPPLIGLLSVESWLAVLAVSVALGLLAALAAAVVGRLRPPADPSLLAGALRVRLWSATLLCLANAALLVVLAAGAWRVPTPTGPVGLAFALLCLLSLTLSWDGFRAAARFEREAGRVGRRGAEGGGVPAH